MPIPARSIHHEVPTTRSPRGARRVVMGLWVALALLGGVGRAHAARFEGPPPWRIGGRVGFTLDAAMFPDTTGSHLEVYLRLPPATLARLGVDEQGRGHVRATLRVRPRGGEPMSSTQEFAIALEDSAEALGQVILMRFPARPGPCRIEARLEDLGTRKHGRLFSANAQNESAELRGEVELARPQAGRELSDPEFLWPLRGRGLGLAFVREGQVRLPNPERLFGFHTATMVASFTARSRPEDVRPWRWTARVLDAAGRTVLRRDSTAAAGRFIVGEVAFDLQDQPAGAYDLDLQVWQEGDAAPLQRRARFSLGWEPETWTRDAEELADDVHFLFQAEEEDAFATLPLGEQERRVAEFWHKRDPTPETAVNEARLLFHERVAYANAQWSRFGLGKGMFTDMGRVYIRYGAPYEITHQVMPAGDETLSKVLEEIMASETRELGEVNQKGPGGDSRPYEVWTYQGDIPVPFDVEPGSVPPGSGKRRLLFLFVDQQGLGTFTLRYSTE
jgi:GWxTD domain-containing protein